MPEHTDVNIDIEFSDDTEWTTTNHLALNLTKTKEIVFKQHVVFIFHPLLIILNN